MIKVTNNSFNSPVIGTDPVTKGTFIITHAYMIYDLDTNGSVVIDSRANGEIRIIGPDNPLYILSREYPLRLQGLVASVMFGVEKCFIRLITTSHYKLREDGICNEIVFDALFNILDNLEYVENIIEYKNTNSL